MAVYHQDIKAKASVEVGHPVQLKNMTLLDKIQLH